MERETVYCPMTVELRRCYAKLDANGDPPCDKCDGSPLGPDLDPPFHPDADWTGNVPSPTTEVTE